MRDSSIFYRSFYEAIKSLPESNQLEVYNAIFEYSFNFVEVELTGLSNTIFTLIKPQLEANNKRYENGNKPKRNQNGSKTEAKDEQKTSKVEANKNKNVNKNKNDNEKVNKNNYGVNENIMLFITDYEKLIVDFGEQKTKQAIDYLSNWGLEKPSKFKEYKNHNLALRRWVFDAIEKKYPESKTETSNHLKVNDYPEGHVHKTYMQRYDESLEKAILVKLDQTKTEEYEF